MNLNNCNKNDKINNNCYYDESNSSFSKTSIETTMSSNLFTDTNNVVSINSIVDIIKEQSKYLKWSKENLNENLSILNDKLKSLIDRNCLLECSNSKIDLIRKFSDISNAFLKKDFNEKYFQKFKIKPPLSKVPIKSTNLKPVQRVPVLPRNVSPQKPTPKDKRPVQKETKKVNPNHTGKDKSPKIIHKPINPYLKATKNTEPKTKINKKPTLVKKPSFAYNNRTTTLHQTKTKGVQSINQRLKSVYAKEEPAKKAPKISASKTAYLNPLKKSKKVSNLKIDINKDDLKFLNKVEKKIYRRASIFFKGPLRIAKNVPPKNGLNDEISVNTQPNLDILHEFSCKFDNSDKEFDRCTQVIEEEEEGEGEKTVTNEKPTSFPDSLNENSYDKSNEIVDKNEKNENETTLVCASIDKLQLEGHSESNSQSEVLKCSIDVSNNNELNSYKTVLNTVEENCNTSNQVNDTFTSLNSTNQQNYNEKVRKEQTGLIESVEISSIKKVSQEFNVKQTVNFCTDEAKDSGKHENNSKDSLDTKSRNVASDQTSTSVSSNQIETEKTESRVKNLFTRVGSMSSLSSIGTLINSVPSTMDLHHDTTNTFVADNNFNNNRKSLPFDPTEFENMNSKSSVDKDLREKLENDMMKKIFGKHREVLKHYFDQFEDDKHISEFLGQEDDEVWRIFISLPSLYDKHAKKLFDLFSNQKIVDDIRPSFIDKRMVGEMVYQVEQRIFNFIYEIEPINRRNIQCGYEPLNIKETIKSLSTDELTGKINNQKFKTYIERYEYLMRSLYQIGYEESVYQDISSFLIMKYGVFPCLTADFQVHIEKYSELQIFFHMLVSIVDDVERDYLIILYTCLLLLAFEDNKPLLTWE